MILSFVSCNKLPPNPRSYSLLPGECLKSTELIFNEAYDASYNGTGVMRFFFSLDMDCTLAALSNSDGYRFEPGKGVFRSFNDKADAVKKAYFDFYDELQFLSSGDLTTIYYNGNEGMQLISHNKFAEYDKGADLGSLLFFPENKYPAFESNLPGIDNSDGLHQLYKRFMVLLPCDVWSINLADIYNFTFIIPVKAGQYLNYLNERLNDPDTKVSFKDMTLTCNITVSFIH